jgi:periplasmic divalent cation tolerance protein
MSEFMSFALVMTTASSPQEAEKIAHALLQEQLAACVQTLPIQSYYTWEGRLNQEPEYLMLIKGRAGNFDQIQACIIANHSYKVPEIIQIPIPTGSPNYLEWMASVSK